VALGDLLVACSDGVHKHVRPDEWQRVLVSGTGLAARCETLIGVARANGSTDDATVLLMQRTGFGVPRPALGGPPPRSGAMKHADIERVFGRGRCRW
jgi:hypothetical protein